MVPYVIDMEITEHLHTKLLAFWTELDKDKYGGVAVLEDICLSRWETLTLSPPLCLPCAHVEKNKQNTHRAMMTTDINEQVRCAL